jgi:hypothetical protein
MRLQGDSDVGHPFWLQAAFQAAFSTFAVFSAAHDSDQRRDREGTVVALPESHDRLGLTHSSDNA